MRVTSRGALLAIILCGLVIAVGLVGLATSGPWTDKWMGTYRIQHGAWKGRLIIATPQLATYNGPNIDIEYIGDDGNAFMGYGYVQGPTYTSGPELVDPVDFVIENASAAIGIRFYIDFAGTPMDDGDDTMFVGYLMGADRLAGFLESPGYYRTFGWYAVRQGAAGSNW